VLGFVSVALLVRGTMLSMGVLIQMDKQQRLLTAAKRLHDKGQKEYTGFMLYMEDLGGRSFWHGMGFGTVYKGLATLMDLGYVTARWEDPVPADRPRRRYYTLTDRGLSEVVSYAH
jgi:hypothetical protein